MKTKKAFTLGKLFGELIATLLVGIFFVVCAGFFATGPYTILSYFGASPWVVWSVTGICFCYIIGLMFAFLAKQMQKDMFNDIKTITKTSLK